MNEPAILVALAKELWDSVISGTQTPSGRERYERMTHPRFGDLVYVWLTRRGTSPEKLIGRYDTCWTYLGEWDPENGMGESGWVWSGPIYGIELLDGGYCKWENVELLALPPWDGSLTSTSDHPPGRPATPR